jgi:hypothetical protein
MCLTIVTWLATWECIAWLLQVYALDCQLRAHEESSVVGDFPLEDDQRRPRQFIGEGDRDRIEVLTSLFADLYA